MHFFDVVDRAVDANASDVQHLVVARSSFATPAVGIVRRARPTVFELRVCADPVRNVFCCFFLSLSFVVDLDAKMQTCIWFFPTVMVPAFFDHCIVLPTLFEPSFLCQFNSSINATFASPRLLSLRSGQLAVRCLLVLVLLCLL